METSSANPASNAISYHSSTASSSAAYSASASYDLHLTVTDSELIAELTAQKDTTNFALQALRIGILALKQVRGELDVKAIRDESDRLLRELQYRLEVHQDSLTSQLTTHLKEYFDPNSGRFPERIQQLVKQGGELEQLLKTQIGVTDSELSKTLAHYLGEQSPLLRLLDPNASHGLLATLHQVVDTSLSQQRDRILSEFSLDRHESALARLVHEMTQRNGSLTEGLQNHIQNLVREFSLDHQDSALSRLVNQVSVAQRQISHELSLDNDMSALARLRRELLGLLEEQRAKNEQFHQGVAVTMAAWTARKEESQKSPRHGLVFQEQVFQFLHSEGQKMGDIVERTGNTTGLIKGRKVGDVLITLGSDHWGAGAKITVEAKEEKDYTLKEALDELEVARKNRGAAVGLFVFSKKTAPTELNTLQRYGQDIVVVWDAEEVLSDIYFHAAFTLAKALCTKPTDTKRSDIDWEALEKAMRELEKQVEGFDEIDKYLGTIQKSSDSIANRARIMRRSFEKQITTLETGLRSLREDSAD